MPTHIFIFVRAVFSSGFDTHNYIGLGSCCYMSYSVAFSFDYPNPPPLPVDAENLHRRTYSWYW